MLTISCPSCRCGLRLPQEMEGQAARCPRCDQTFVATADLEVRPAAGRDSPPISPPWPTPATDPAPVAGPAGLPDVRCPYCGEWLVAESRRCRFCGGTLAQDAPPAAAGRRLPLRRDCEPHRGLTVQLLGIGSLGLGLVSFFFCGLPSLVGIPLGLAAWSMARRDLHKMERGEMEREGRRQTLSGRLCGILGVVFGLLFGLCGAAVLGFALLDN